MIDLDSTESIKLRNEIDKLSITKDLLIKFGFIHPDSFLVHTQYLPNDLNQYTANMFYLANQYGELCIRIGTKDFITWEDYTEKYYPDMHYMRQVRLLVELETYMRIY